MSIHDNNNFYFGVRAAEKRQRLTVYIPQLVVCQIYHYELSSPFWRVMSLPRPSVTQLIEMRLGLSNCTNVMSLRFPASTILRMAPGSYEFDLSLSKSKGGY
jgi:hypothetical protein